MNNGRKKNEWEQNWKHWKQVSFFLRLENRILRKIIFFPLKNGGCEFEGITRKIFLMEREMK